MGATGGGSNSANGSDGPTDAAALARNVDAGIVDITTTVTGGEAAGTGMVITSSGEVLTNNHVIDGATRISVRDVGNGKTYSATVVGYDRSHDVAVLQLSGASGLTTVKTASSEPGSGAAVVGVGNAGGAGGTPSYASGAITGVDKTITASDEYDGTSEKLAGLLGTDADIQAGDSGGPLVDSSGEVVGMDTAASAGYSLGGFGAAGTGASESRSFAIPITTALTIAAEIERSEASATVHIGPTAQLGVYVSGATTRTSGAIVVKTRSGGPAAKAGIVRGDVITGVDGTQIRDAAGLTAEMTRLSSGQAVAISYATPTGAPRTTRVTLGTGAPQ
jgi:S1-C subfamily serine protease